MGAVRKDIQFYRFCAYGFLKNLRLFDAFIILFLREAGMTFTQIGGVYAARELATNLMEIPSGLASDTLGRKHTLLLSFVLYILSFLLLFYGTSFVYFLVAFIVFGVGDAFRSGTHKGMIMDYLEHQGLSHTKVAYYGSTRSCSQLGSAISSLVAAGMVVYGGNYRIIFLFSVFPYLLNMVNIATYPSFLQVSRMEGRKPVLQAFKETFAEFFRLLRRPFVQRIIQSSAIYSAWIKTVKDYVQIVLIHLGMFLPVLITDDEKLRNTWAVGIGYFVLYLFNAAASKNAAYFEGKRPFRAAWILMVVGFSAGVLAGGSYVWELWSVSWFLFVVIYAIENVRKPLLTGVLSDAVPNDVLTSLLSAQSLVRTLWTAVLALVFGGMADAWGVGHALWLLSMGLFFFSLLSGRWVKGDS